MPGQLQPGNRCAMHFIRAAALGLDGLVDSLAVYVKGHVFDQALCGVAAKI